MPKTVIILLLPLLLCLGCSSSDSPTVAPRSPTTGSATNSTRPQTTIPLPTVPATDLATFRSAELGFEFSYPRRLDTASNAACRPALQPDGRVVGVGSNVSISVETSQSVDLNAFAQAFLRRAGAAEERRTTVLNLGGGALRIEYRLLPSARFGIATFTVHAGRSYTLVFEARNPGQCGESDPTELYDQIIGSLRFM